MRSRVKKMGARRDEPITDLEIYLSKALAPVEPRSTFVTNLEVRLRRTPILKKSMSKGLQILMLTMVGLLSGAVIVLTSMRLLMLILGAIGILRRIRAQSLEKPSTRLQAAQ